MKKLLFKLVLLSIIVGVIMIPIIWRFEAGYSDAFYTRLTTDKAPSLILGTSRAAQALQPQVFQKLAPEMQNFAFTNLHSPFGTSYLKLIQKKLDLGVKNGLFIIAVDPWGVSSLTKEETKLENFREYKVFTSQIHLVNMAPNLEYILKHYDKPLYYVIAEDVYYAIIGKSPPMKLHRNGWLEVNVSVDSAAVQQRIQEKIEDYSRYATDGAISPIRLNALRETVKYLSNYGKVFLVRLPVSRELAEIEKNYSPTFDEMMQEISHQYSAPYLNYFSASGQYLTTDGNHLYKDAGKVISQKVETDIAKITQVSSLREKN